MNVVKNVALISRIFRVLEEPQQFFADKLKLYKEPSLIVKLRNGLSFIIHSGNSDINSIGEIFLSGGYDSFWESIDKNFTVVDIGANIGILSVGAAEKGARVFGFEPNPVIYPMLLENISRNNFNQRISVYPLGIAGGKGYRPMYFEENHWGGATLLDQNIDKKTKYDVKCIGLQDIFDIIGLNAIDILKIDCEGAEGEIFANATDETLKKIKKIFLEYHEPDGSKSELRARLEKNNFVVEEIAAFPA